MYCSKRFCYNEIWLDANNDQSVCKQHYDEMVKRVKEMKEEAAKKK